MSVAVEGNAQYEFGTFDVPQNNVFYFVGAILYETAFGEVELMRAGFKIEMTTHTWNPYWDLDWRLWDAEVHKVRRQKRRLG